MPLWTSFARSRYTQTVRFLTALGCASGCSTSPAPAPTDASAPQDLAVVTDTGAPTDTGTGTDTAAPTDTGTPTDAGAPTDTGTPTDAGTPVDGGSATDGAVGDLGTDAGVTDAGSADAGPLNGYIRFLNLAPGVGTVRFIAVNQPGFTPSSIEAVVPEGSSSGYIETQPVAYFIDVVAAPGGTPGVSTDGGVGDGGATLDGSAPPPTDGAVSTGTDASADAPDDGIPRLAGRITSDVYFRSGCTVIFAGTPTGNLADQTTRQLWRISDIPMRTSEPGIGLVRVVGAVPEGPPLDIDEGTTALAHLVQYFEPTGFRRVMSGTRHYTVRDDDDSSLLLPDLPAMVAEGQPHTLYVWGLAGHDAGAGMVHGILTNDLPPGR